MACMLQCPGLVGHGWPWSTPGQRALPSHAPISFYGDSKPRACLGAFVTASAASAASAWAAARRRWSRHGARLTLPRWVAGGFLVEGNCEATTQLPSAVSIGKLLTWARKQEFMKVHPVLSARASQLSVSVPVEAGTPLLGVLEDGFLTFEPEPSEPSGPSDSGEGPWQHLYQVARRQHPDWWALHLAIPLLRQSFSASSTSPIWQAHQQSA